MPVLFYQRSVTMPFKTFTELYEKDVRPKLKENTWLTKEHIIKTKYCRILSISDYAIYRQKMLSLGKMRLEGKQIQVESRFLRDI